MSTVIESIPISNYLFTIPSPIVEFNNFSSLSIKLTNDTINEMKILQYDKFKNKSKNPSVQIVETKDIDNQLSNSSSKSEDDTNAMVLAASDYPDTCVTTSAFLKNVNSILVSIFYTYNYNVNN